MLTTTYNLFLDILSPPLCAFCTTLLAQRTPLCAECTLHIKPVMSTALALNKQYTLQVHALSSYENPLRKLILAKNRSNIIASYQLATLMREGMPSILEQADIFIPLPLHWTRYAWRGFNQAEILAQALAKKHHKSCKNLLKRVRRTAFQASLKAPERTRNVAQAFRLIDYSEEYQGKHLVLVDDLMTTGATLHAAARELIALKPASISTYVACRVV